MKFSLKLFIIISEIAIIPLLIVGYIAYFNIKQQISQSILNKLDIIAQIQKNRLQSNINDSIELLNLFTAKSQLRSYLSNFNNTPTQELQESMNNNILDSKKNSVVIKKIMIANPSGIIVSSTDPLLIGNDISNENYFKQGIKQNDVSFIIKDSSSGQIDRYLVGPFILNYKIIGMGIIITSVNNLASLIDDYTGLENSGEILLVKNDGSGNALFLGPARFDKNAALSRIVAKENPNTAIIPAVNGEEKVFAEAVNYRNEPVLAATRYIKSTGWGVVVEMNQSEAMLPLERLQKLFLFILLTVIFLIIVIIIPTSISITKPIKKLIFLAQKITNGDLTQNLQIKSKDEIGELSYFLNKMLDSLKKITEKFKNLNLNLEKEIRLKTSKLENQNVFLSKFNKAMLNLSEDLEEEKSKLKTAKIHNEAILTSVGDALMAVDGKKLITVMNPVAEKMLGYKSPEVMGKSIFDMILLENENGEQIPNDKRPMSVSFLNKKIVSATYYCIRKDKTKFIAAITSAPIISGNNIIGAVDIFRDVTKEKEMDKIKTEFVSLASHQLRTPATAVKWYAEMLSDKNIGKLNKKQRQYLEQVYRGNERMIKLIDNLLSISRIELGKISIKKEPIDINKFLKNIINEQKVGILKRKQKLIIEQPAGKIKISADPILLRIIFQNFISNAIKYTLDKGKIICTIDKKDSKFLFSVKDNGVGIPEKEQKRIFERLFRASNSLELDREGNGLGLYIVRQIADALGGKTWFESEFGKGTTFYFELPVKE